jgi:hypothetical protein
LPRDIAENGGGLRRARSTTALKSPPLLLLFLWINDSSLAVYSEGLR